MEEGSNNLLKDWVLPILAALVIAIVINKTLFFKSKIPTASMHPTIQKGDQVFVTRVYNKDKLHRGDIVLFNSKELNLLLVKRLIGLPGDTVEIKQGGVVYINGTMIDEPYVINKDNKTGTFKVPENSFLFLGDNRADSFDSRYWKNPYIEKKDIVGRAWIIIYPFNRIKFLK